MVNNNRANIALRRQQLWTMILKGEKTSAMASALHVGQRTISQDVKFMVKDSNKYLNQMARETLPYMYKQSIEGIQQILRECWIRYERDHTYVWLRLALDCRIEIFNQVANGVSVAAVKSITERANALGIGST